MHGEMKYADLFMKSLVPVKVFFSEVPSCTAISISNIGGW